MPSLNQHQYLKYYSPALVWGFFIAILCFTPGHEIPNWSLFTFDKIGHFGIMAILHWLIQFGYYKSHSRIIYLMPLINCILYSIAIESIQGLFIMGRSADILDFVADTLGCICALISCYLYIYYSKNRKK